MANVVWWAEAIVWKKVATLSGEKKREEGGGVKLSPRYLQKPLGKEWSPVLTGGPRQPSLKAALSAAWQLASISNKAWVFL